jgi:Transposase DDE domain
VGVRTIIETIPDGVVTFIEKLRAELCDAQFLDRHRVRRQDFTRDCQLTFPIVMLFILQKTAKSIQRHLHEFLNRLAGDELFEPVSAGAVTHARAKLKHTAFVELNNEVVVPAVYGEQPLKQVQRWRGHRLLGVDGSVLRLPNHPELFEQFTPVPINSEPNIATKMYPQARISVLYDLLNRVGLDGQLRPGSQGEVGLAVEQLDQARGNDIIVTDRGYTGYPYLSAVIYMGLHFISRCSTASFAAAQELFRMNRAGRSIITKIMVAPEHRQHVLECGRSLELTVRFISLRLPTGELEVLVTSLVDEQEYPTEEFLEVYNSRWNEETFFFLLKSRLDLENFSGHTAEAVRQDFYSTLLLSNIESVLIEPTASTLAKEGQDLNNTTAVNHAVSYHAIKHRLIDLLYSDTPAVEVVTELQKWFRGAPVCRRKNRKVARPKPSLYRSYYFQKCVKKITF